MPSSLVATRMSMPQTSFSANVAASKPFFCSSDCRDRQAKNGGIPTDKPTGLRIMRFLPSITFFSCWQLNMPARTNRVIGRQL